MSFEDRIVLALKDIFWNIIAPQFHVEPLGSKGNDHLPTAEADKEKSDRGGSEDETYGGDDHKGQMASDRDESSVDDSRDGNSDNNSGENNDKHTRGRHTSFKPHTP